MKRHIKLPTKMKTAHNATSHELEACAKTHTLTTGGQQVVTLVLPYPPSANRLWRHVGHKVLLSREGRNYTAHIALKLHGVPGFGTSRLKVDVSLFPPDSRVRDIDNPIKPLLDSMQKAGLYKSDGQIDSLLVVRKAKVRGGLVQVVVSVAE